jgi:hypothetical protein
VGVGVFGVWRVGGWVLRGWNPFFGMRLLWVENELGSMLGFGGMQ